jgi:hypothetical protein
MRATAFLLTLPLLCSGCFSTVVVPRPVSAADAEHIARAANGRAVTVELHSSDRVSLVTVGRGALGGDTSAFAFEAVAQPPTRIRFDDIHRVVVKNREKGSLEGFLMGAIPGALIGMAVGSAFDGAGCSDDGSGMKSSCPVKATVVMGICGAMLSGVVGSVIGASIGHRTAYTFRDP